MSANPAREEDEGGHGGGAEDGKRGKKRLLANTKLVSCSERKRRRCLPLPLPLLMPQKATGNWQLATGAAFWVAVMPALHLILQQPLCLIDRRPTPATKLRQPCGTRFNCCSLLLLMLLLLLTLPLPSRQWQKTHRTQTVRTRMQQTRRR